MVPYYGKVLYGDESIANIFYITNLVNKCRVAYKSHQDDPFTVHTNRGIIKSRRNKQGLYFSKPTNTTANYNVAKTVEENVVGFTRRQIEWDRLAVKIYINIVLPTVKKFTHMVSTNIILNCTIIVADIKNA